MCDCGKHRVRLAGRVGWGGMLKFDDPMFVMINGEEREIIELSHAARLLLEEWPLAAERRRLAMQAILKSLRDEVSVGDGRRAFVDAALEVWVFRAGQTLSTELEAICSVMLPRERVMSIISADEKQSGGCLCGKVRFTVAGRPLRVGLCHCHDCRRTSGGSFSFFAVWPRSAYEGSGDLATHAGRSFCPECGSRVADLRSDEAEIMVGAFDNPPTDLIPSYELWTPRRENWLHALPWAEQYDGDRTVDTAT